MVTIKVKTFSKLRDKMKGLMFAQKAYPVLIETRFGIHTFGLKFNIDVLVLDKSNKVVKLKKKLRPNKIFIWNPKFNKVIELPAGEIDKQNIEIGKTLTLVEI